MASRTLVFILERLMCTSFTRTSSACLKRRATLRRSRLQWRKTSGKTSQLRFSKRCSPGGGRLNYPDPMCQRSISCIILTAESARQNDIDRSESLWCHTTATLSGALSPVFFEAPRYSTPHDRERDRVLTAR